ncbi:hypothetical protein N7603_01990 [Acholeplasma vituli]|jgi:hypothetical protein|uniref:Transposase n=2 Tax=Paracholeplasma vituli TaxID=69473 RepID=A0ABT2PTZ8_9MOLU|nr:hypothetical protein [Paracholeplasma vituli]
MMRKDNYQTWKNDGVLQSKLKLIKELASRSCGMGVIATELGVSENTLYSLRKKYKDVEKSYEDGRNMLKKSLLEKMFERAMGFTIVNEDQIIEQTPTGTKKKVIKQTRTILGDMGVARYLLIINFGKEYSEKKYELELSEQKVLERQKENDWKPMEIGDINATNKQEDK